MTISARYLTLAKRVARARDHLDTLDREFKRWVDGTPPIVRREVQANGWVAQFHTMTEEPPDDLGIIVGDFAHNLRSVLDNLVYEIVSANPEWTGKPRDSSAFPIEKFEKDFLRKVDARRPNDRHGVLDGVPVPCVTLIRNLQPYNRGDGRSEGVETMRVALDQLRDLNNRDKHRTIQPSVAHLTTEEPRFTVVPKGTARVVNFERPTRPTPLEAGAEVKALRYRTVILDPERHVKVNVKMSVAVVVGEGRLKLGTTDLRNMTTIIEGLTRRLWELAGHEVPPRS